MEDAENTTFSGCSVDKLLIKGIRAFSPENKTAIEFYKPLTLIVGHNGAGKTTIIECLKMATTGDLPPNIKNGQAFVNDPKVAGVSEVKAQIKLRFRTVVGKQVMCIRSFQLTQRAASMQYKSLDVRLNTTNKQGEQVAISNRCADTDKQVPALMGVSKAVLDNVIFVHQDDSNWPLGDGATLKKRFDDIFAATRYTKALEAIRKLKTEQGQLIKELKLKLETLHTHQNQAMKLQANIKEETSKAELLGSSISDDDAAIATCAAEIEATQNTLEDIHQTDEQLTVLSTQWDMKKQENAQRYSALEEIVAEDLEELVSGEERLEGSLQELRRRREEKEGAVNQRKMEVEALKERYASDLQKQGRLRAEADMHAQRLRARHDLCVHIAHTHAALADHPILSQDPANPSPEVVATFRSDCAGQVAAAGAAVEEAQQRGQREDQRLAQLLVDLQGQLADVQRRQEAARLQQAQGSSKLARLQEDARTASVSEQQFAEITRRLEEARSKVERARADAAQDDSASKLSDIKAEMEKVGRRMSELNQERDVLASASEETQRVRVKREELAKKDEQCRTLLEACRPQAARVLAAPLHAVPEDPAECKLYCQQQLQAVEESARRQQKEVATRQQSAAGVQGRLQDEQQRCRDLGAEVARLRSRLLQGLREADPAGPADLEAELDASGPELLTHKIREAEGQLEHRRTELNNRNTLSQLWGVYIKRTEEGHQCPLCSRGWQAQHEEDEFVAQMRRNMQASPDILQRLEADVQGAQARLAALQDLHPSFTQFQQARAVDLPQSEAAVRRLQQQAEELGNEVDCATAEGAELEARRGKLAGLMPEVVEADRVFQDARALREELRARDRHAPSQGGGPEQGRTVQELNSLLDDLEFERKKLEAERERIGTKQERSSNALRVLEAQHSDVREEHLRAEQQQQRRRELGDQARELEQELERLQQEGSALAAQVAPLEAERDAQAAARQAARAAAQDREAGLTETLRRIQRDVDKLEQHCADIHAYTTSGREAEAKRLQDTIQKTLDRQRSSEQDLIALTKVLEDMDGELAGQDSGMRILRDNIAYKRGLEQEEALRGQVQGLQGQRGAIGDPAALQRTLLELQQQCEELKRRQNMQRGSLSQVQASIDRSQRELGAEQYRGIGRRYKDKLVELRTTEMANHDLTKYYTALDKALMKFHTGKMTEINKIIKELWQQTYQGQDIDYIQVRADMEGVAKGSYNYRLVMRCNDAELDMRGRCSAGQRVLACLIIRLALAETFCLKCGILALDEPTTNLDATNSHALALSLVNIMQARKDQKNFQLIVITHDEHFAHMIGQRQHAEYYWRVTKDENQHSIIERETI